MIDIIYVTVINSLGNCLLESLPVCQINTYKWGFNLIKIDGSRTEYPCKYSFNVNINGNNVLIRIED